MSMHFILVLPHTWDQHNIIKKLIPTQVAKLFAIYSTFMDYQKQLSQTKIFISWDSSKLVCFQDWALNWRLVAKNILRSMVKNEKDKSSVGLYVEGIYVYLSNKLGKLLSIACVCILLMEAFNI